MTPIQKREVVKFASDVPVEVALKFAMPGKVISTPSGERVLYTLADERVMFMDLAVARQIEDLGVNVREKFFVCRPAVGKKDAQWAVWRSPEPEKAHAAAEVAGTPQPEVPAEAETPLEQKLRESIELVKQGKLGELGNGTFAVPAGASAVTPAPVQADGQNGHHASNNGNGSTNGKNGNGAPKHPEASVPPTWAQSLLGQTNALVDVYAAALSTASTKHGNQVKPEDVRTLLVTVYIQCSKGGLYASWPGDAGVAGLGKESRAEAAAYGASRPTSGFIVPGVDPDAAVRSLWLRLAD